MCVIKTTNICNISVAAWIDQSAASVHWVDPPHRVIEHAYFLIAWQWCDLRPSVLGQDRSGTKRSVLVLVFVLQVWCCVVKYGLVTLVVIMIFKDTTTFQVLYIVSLFCTCNITTVEINSGVHLGYLKVKSAKCLCLLPVVLVLVLLFWFLSWSWP